MTCATKAKFDNDQAIANKIIELLESGSTPPWQKPWSSPLGETNALTGNPYRGGEPMDFGPIPFAMGFQFLLVDWDETR